MKTHIFTVCVWGGGGGGGVYYYFGQETMLAVSVEVYFISYISIKQIYQRTIPGKWVNLLIISHDLDLSASFFYENRATGSLCVLKSNKLMSRYINPTKTKMGRVP